MRGLLACGATLGRAACGAVLAVLSGCGPSEGEELDQLGAMKLTIQGAPFALWVADDEAERARGLMFVTPERMRPLADGSERGMIFVYDADAPRSFWMKDTFVPLDLVYLDSEGTVVDVHTMTPLDERKGQYASSRPAGYAIEVMAGTCARLGVQPGARIDLWQ